MSSCFFTSLYFLASFSFIVRAVVPASQTFKFVNEGYLEDYSNEYNANFRILSIATYPFRLCFYNTTPNSYTLALRMGSEFAGRNMRWVWEANRGNPIGENATFSLGTDGNLILANADGRVMWQSSTANKGVVGFKLLSNGNMVLYDFKGSFVWQSFDFPSDTLLVGQSLKVGGPRKLVSRFSEKQNKDGPYSLVLGPYQYAMYYKSENSPTPMIYYNSTDTLLLSHINSLNFTCEPENNSSGVAYAYTLRLEDHNGNSQVLSKTNYESTLSYLRLGIDGNLRAYTFYDKETDNAWEETFTLFTRESGEECQLPERCGNFGLCEDSQCVACPLPQGLMGWSKNCNPPKLTSCKGKDMKYYKLKGVDHFITKYEEGVGPVTRAQCLKKCSNDCKCLAYFYREAESMCWTVNDLKTLTRVANSAHLGYIKAPIDK